MSLCQVYMLVANTVTVMSKEGEQDEEEILNTWLQVSQQQEDDGMVAEPQLIPEIESV